MDELLRSHLAAIGWVDWLLIAVLALSIVVGLWRGLLFEVLALASWVVAWFAAQWAAPLIAPHLPVGSRGGGLNMGAAFALAFVGALLAWALLARLLRLLIQATPLSLPDRLLGGAFGVVRGAVALLAVATIVAYTPAAQSHEWRASQGARWLGQTLSVLKPLLPEPAARLLKA
jgi:membrane protein required for colicin V production